MGRANTNSADDAKASDTVTAVDGLSSIRSILAKLVVVCVLPGVLVAVFLISNFYQREREQLDQDMLQTVHSLALAVDSDLATTEAALEALATSPYLTTGNLAAFHDQARHLTQGVGIGNGGLRRPDVLGDEGVLQFLFGHHYAHLAYIGTCGGSDQFHGDAVYR